MKNIWIIGAGIIAKEYAKVLNSLGYDYLVIGRGEEKAKIIEDELGKMVIRGGLDKFLKTNPIVPKYVIVATNVEQLSNNTIALINYGVKNILVEKPGFCYPEECEEIVKIAKMRKADVLIAYNRRYYASVLAAERIISEDGGVTSFNFEFTEWSHTISVNDYALPVLNNWLYANSSHVIDLAFYMGGQPIEFKTFSNGMNLWHRPVNYAGAGITDKGALFNYAANWLAPGRWGVEILTSKHRLYLRPMEKLQIQEIGSVVITPVDIDDILDVGFKPGFYLQTKAFVENDYSRLCSIEEQLNHIKTIYEKILN